MFFKWLLILSDVKLVFSVDASLTKAFSTELSIQVRNLWKRRLSDWCICQRTFKSNFAKMCNLSSEKKPWTGSPNRDERGRAIDFLGKQFRYKCQVGKAKKQNTFGKDTFRDKEKEQENENKDEDK